MARLKYVTFGQILALMESAVDAGFTYTKRYSKKITFGELVELKTQFTKCKLYGVKVFINGDFLTWIRFEKVPVKGWFLLDTESDEENIIIPWSLKTDVAKTPLFANGDAGVWIGRAVVKILKIYTDAEEKKAD